jgi:capsular exopolysaccharide synthesis family protein
VSDRRPDRARRFAEAIANQFVLASKAQQLEAVRATQEFSLEQQQIYKHKLDDSEGRLESFKRGVLTTGLVGGGVTEGNLSRARTLLDQAELDVQEQQTRLSALRGQLQEHGSRYDPNRLSNAETAGMTAQLKGLERQIASSQLLGDTGGDGSSARLSSARKISDLEIQFTQNATLAYPDASPDVRDALVRYRLTEADLGAKEARRAYLAGQVGGYEQRVVMTPDRDANLIKLQQEVDNNRALYNSFLTQSASAQITEAFENARVSGRFVVLEPANLPRTPGKPNRPVIILLALVLGGIVGVGSVLMAERQDQSMKNAEEVEILLGLPVLGAVPRVEELERSTRRSKGKGAAAATARDPGLLHRLKTETPLGLEFRRIFLKLAKSRGRTLPNTLLMTSSTRGEGKTTTTACLAITLARELDEKILLVDFDLRSPALHRALGLPSSSWGLAQMLAQQKFDERFVRSTVLPNLDFLAAGRSERPASELIDSDTVDWFLHEARSRYAYVLLDSAPNLAVPDPLILGRAVDGVLYVVKAGQTVRKAAEYGVKVQREARDNILGVLLNDAGEVLPHYYGYHDAYGYTSEVAGAES